MTVYSAQAKETFSVQTKRVNLNQNLAIWDATYLWWAAICENELWDSKNHEVGEMSVVSSTISGTPWFAGDNIFLVEWPYPNSLDWLRCQTVVQPIYYLQFRKCLPYVVGAPE